MLKQINTDNRGFTIIEIVVVLVLISIIAAATFQRSVSTDQTSFRSQFDKIQNQVRYPQSIAMKRNEWWGFACETNNYWIFTGTNKDIVANQRPLPGQTDIIIPLTDGVIMTHFTVVFDSFGIPYWGNWNTKMDSAKTVALTDPEGNFGSFEILPETGLIR